MAVGMKAAVGQGGLMLEAGKARGQGNA